MGLSSAVLWWEEWQMRALVLSNWSFVCDPADIVLFEIEAAHDSNAACMLILCSLI